MLCAQGVAAPLMLSSLLLQLVRANLPSGCLIASDILSCTNLGLDQVPVELPVMVATLDFNHNRLEHLEEGSFAGLPNLDTVRLAHNQLSRLTPGTFRNTSNIRHLDLSSNQLNIIEEHYFQELVGIKELLLYNNHIVRVESKALSGLSNLQKAYLSHNRLTDFPFFSIQEHPNLTTLDLSSNRMPNLPVKDIEALKEKIQSGLFLHNNSLICECSMYSLFKQWEYRGFTSVTDFWEEHTCLIYGEQRAMVRFLKHVRYFENCKIKPPVKKVSMEAYAGDSVMLDCITSLKGKHLNYSWISDRYGYIAPPFSNNTLRMHSNGSLEILALDINDSGVYLCMVQNHQESSNDSLEVNVTVQIRHQEDEPFNTGFTTLLGCVVSLILVLMYLFLTPCRCWCRKQPIPATPNPANECSAQSSILTPTPPATTEGPGRKVSNNKHVVFLEPIKEAQNGRLQAALALDYPKLAVTRSDADSVTSVFSDTTIVP
ncbi:amphoterin-induced protein 3-like isoform X1 [Sinocyclocheilus anshuiensis]|uniref:amphoterin-induced protein 3-like isoform X1 n=1 Tax=Sinocyclocheilus anshuiensis TaxID=1608454 RepID=UPI0007B9F004|nr:PREDICTED: amphoterin-induced protein 3-like isoform X1 [Sinocyclocheilus anshuiensis]XP_016307190.1 PREDICTED: amphoterin-induced protein 3-like isoform X1 [Sinocyclocheilus anshuiensis]